VLRARRAEPFDDSYEETAHVRRARGRTRDAPAHRANSSLRARGRRRAQADAAVAAPRMPRRADGGGSEPLGRPSTAYDADLRVAADGLSAAAEHIAILHPGPRDHPVVVRAITRARSGMCPIVETASAVELRDRRCARLSRSANGPEAISRFGRATHAVRSVPSAPAPTRRAYAAWTVTIEERAPPPTTTRSALTRGCCAFAYEDGSPSSIEMRRTLRCFLQTGAASALRDRRSRSTRAPCARDWRESLPFGQLSVALLIELGEAPALAQPGR
jgi:hypothetical protein